MDSSEMTGCKYQVVGKNTRSEREAKDSRKRSFDPETQIAVQGGPVALSAPEAEWQWDSGVGTRDHLQDGLDQSRPDG
jgi:hypothetical protein